MINIEETNLPVELPLPGHKLTVTKQQRMIRPHRKHIVSYFHPLFAVLVHRVQQLLVLVNRPVHILLRPLILQLISLLALQCRTRAHILTYLCPAHAKLKILNRFVKRLLLALRPFAVFQLRIHLQIERVDTVTIACTVQVAQIVVGNGRADAMLLCVFAEFISFLAAPVSFAVLFRAFHVVTLHTQPHGSIGVELFGDA